MIPNLTFHRSILNKKAFDITFINLKTKKSIFGDFTISKLTKQDKIHIFEKCTKKHEVYLGKKYRVGREKTTL